MADGIKLIIEMHAQKHHLLSYLVVWLSMPFPVGGHLRNCTKHENTTAFLPTPGLPSASAFDTS